MWNFHTCKVWQNLKSFSCYVLTRVWVCVLTHYKFFIIPRDFQTNELSYFSIYFFLTFFFVFFGLSRRIKKITKNNEWIQLLENLWIKHQYIQEKQRFILIQPFILFAAKLTNCASALWIKIKIKHPCSVDQLVLANKDYPNVTRIWMYKHKFIVLSQCKTNLKK